MSQPVLEDSTPTAPPACLTCGASFAHFGPHAPEPGFLYCQDCPNVSVDEHGCVDHVCPEGDLREPSCVVSNF